MLHNVVRCNLYLGVVDFYKCTETYLHRHGASRQYPLIFALHLSSTFRATEDRLDHIRKKYSAMCIC